MRTALSGTRRVLRGGSWDYGPNDARCSARVRYVPLHGHGFRAPGLSDYPLPFYPFTLCRFV